MLLYDKDEDFYILQILKIQLLWQNSLSLVLCVLNEYSGDLVKGFSEKIETEFLSLLSSKSTGSYISHNNSNNNITFLSGSDIN